MKPKFLELWRMTKIYPSMTGPVAVVRDFSLTITEGEFVCLIGHSGCGKSTILSMVAGLTPMDGGAVVVDHTEVDGPGLDRGLIFQAPCLLPWLSALDNVLLAVDQAARGKLRADRVETAAQFLDLVGLADARHKRPAALSGGMRQRVGIARAFALSPKVLLLDEPFGMLDCVTRMELQDALLELWNERRLTALMVTHDVDEALYLADRIVMMTNGPEAQVGGVLEVNFPRPRDRAHLLEHPDYYRLREALISFLESQEISKRASPTGLPGRSPPLPRNLRPPGSRPRRRDDPS